MSFNDIHIILERTNIKNPQETLRRCSVKDVGIKFVYFTLLLSMFYDSKSSVQESPCNYYWQQRHVFHAILSKYLLIAAILYNSTELIKYNIALTIQGSTKITSCCKLLTKIIYLSLNKVLECLVLQMQWVFSVEHHLVFRDTFPDTPVYK